MIKCSVCESEFIPRANEHYIARDNTKYGLTSIVENNEVKLYDAFDCPVCGCQVIIKERKRAYVPCDFSEEVEEENNE